MASLAARPTLLVSFTTDIASVTLAAAMRAEGGPWERSGAPTGALWRAAGRDPAASAVYLWELDEEPINADHIDQRFADATRCPHPEQVLFLSRHVSAAGTRSLCVHPIGNPRAELAAEHGGRAGACVPPAPRLAALYRLLAAELAADAAVAGAVGGEGGWQPSFEATHHGPWLEHSAAAFVEIGSDASAWANADAGSVWARALARALGLGGRRAEAPGWAELSEAERAAATVVCVLGGGHYMPAASDVVKGSDGSLYVGHMLASYSLPLAKADGAAADGAAADGEDAEGESWRRAVDEAVRATRAAFPGAGHLCALVPQKAFGAEARSALASHLELGHGLRCLFKKQDVLGAHRARRAARDVAASGASR
jgi:D-tyrosyl-tRNA(Tyr) deacylase